MKHRVDLANALGLGVALACSLWVTPIAQPTRTNSDIDAEEPASPYSRILSASVVADELLLELCEPDRIVGFTRFSKHSGPHSYRFQGKPTVPTITDVEAILALSPDLVLVHSVGDPRPVARLREARITVVDLGPVEGVSTLVPDIVEVARLIGHPARGDRLIENLTEQLRSIAIDIPVERRKRGLYAKVLGNQIYGGSTGSSFHDVLTYGGLIDVAATQYQRHPVYTAEQLLALDPPLVVLNEGTGKLLCARPGLSRHAACKDSQGIIEIPTALLESAALGIVDAARAVRNAVYGPAAM